MKKMKKKYIIIIVTIVLICLTAGIVLSVKTKRKENEKEVFDTNIVSNITMDINPSIELDLNKDNLVVKMVALNEDATFLIKDYESLTLEETFNIIIDLLKTNNYLNEETTILVNSSNEEVKKLVATSLNAIAKNKNVSINLVSLNIEKNEELEKLASDNNITVAKAYYINEEIKDKEGIVFSDYVNENVSVIKEKVEEKLKEIEEEKRIEEEKKDEEQSYNYEENYSGGGGYGSLDQCDYVAHNFSKEQAEEAVRNIVGSNVFIVSNYAYLYNGQCSWRIDLVADGAEHSFIYSEETGEQLADLITYCYACNFDQIMNITASYYNVSTNQIMLNTSESGGFGSSTSDIDFTLDGVSHYMIFDRYSGAVISVN